MLLNYNKKQSNHNQFTIGQDVIAKGVQVLRINGGGRIEQVATIDEEPLAVFLKLDQARRSSTVKFNIIVWDFNTIVLKVYNPKQPLIDDCDPNTNYFQNYSSHQTDEAVRKHQSYL